MTHPHGDYTTEQVAIEVLRLSKVEKVEPFV